MFTHEPKNYVCPFCALLRGEDDLKSEKDIVYQDDFVTAFISPKWWANNPGHVLVVPNLHTENIYSISDELLSKVYAVAKKIACAIRENYDNCTGTSMRQHNEPDGNQDVWHFHVHVFPRHEDDNLYLNHENKSFVSKEARLPYAEILRRALNWNNS